LRVVPRPEEIAEIYMDESSLNNHRHRVIGCVINMVVDAPTLKRGYRQSPQSRIAARPGEAE
jgi:hypothetical protein